MRLERIDVRFFRSFNFDFEMKARPEKTPQDWEDTEDGWFPFVRIPLDESITAVVGANESGKSQLLTAIEASLTGVPIQRADFCRYSELYSVQAGKYRFPEFGAMLRLMTAEDVNALPARFNVGIGEKFALYRTSPTDAYVVTGNTRHNLDPEELAQLQPRLPNVFKLETAVALPDSVSIRELAGMGRSRFADRKQRTDFLDVLADGSFLDPGTFGQTVYPHYSSAGEHYDAEITRRRETEFLLARKLLIDVAGVDQRAFQELLSAISAGREGQVAGIIGGINGAIKERLNFQRWWTQDKAFDLVVEAREHELAFTIRDRTAASYSFDERSQGLRFFLSYFVQLTAHRLQNRVPDVLLLDEPDAYLSSVGQQDLLRILENYAFPEEGGPASQVVYVTHSPFLINKNTPHRIRVLDKGAEDEGTKVVNDAANNRYEPLRSSLGAYVAETAFIGGANLFVEGMADQVYLAGASAQLIRLDVAPDEVLDLNAVTIVAAGSADSIPYMVYLARGRDSVKPPCVALLDGDTSGKDAARVLRRGEARKKRVLAEDCIVEMPAWMASAGMEADEGVTATEIEDLVPLRLLRKAALSYLGRFLRAEDINEDALTVDEVQKSVIAKKGNAWEGLSAAYQKAFVGEHIEKVGLAREVIRFVAMNPGDPLSVLFLDRFGQLIRHLAQTLRAAQQSEDRRRSDNRTKRLVSSFKRDHPGGVRRFRARRLLQEIGASLGDSPYSDSVAMDIRSIERTFGLDVGTPQEQVPNYYAFKTRLDGLLMLEKMSYQDEEGDPRTASPATSGPEVPFEEPIDASQLTQT
jgi:predicted ATPase